MKKTIMLCDRRKKEEKKGRSEEGGGGLGRGRGASKSGPASSMAIMTFATNPLQPQF